MRIACVHIPQFALQCATRIDPSLRRSDSAVVVVGPLSLALAASPAAALASKPSAPIVLACSRAAWSLGARVGMTATAARSLSPLIAVVTADPQIERDTVRAIADVLLALSPVVDVGGRVGPGGAHLALYCEVPAKTRGTSYGDRLLDRLESLGLTGRIGIADDRFTAWVAAWLGAWEAHARSTTPASATASATASASASASPVRHDETGVVSVPRGGSAAFLAPRPLSLLSISPEVQHMLEALGVRTLGEFAALPAPTVSSRAARFEADYQALARGESGNVLRPYAPDAPIREDAILRTPTGTGTGTGIGIGTGTGTGIGIGTGTGTATTLNAPLHPPLELPSNAPSPDAGTPLTPLGLSAPAAVALLAERVAMRLAGRARCAARLDITIGGEAGERVVTVAPVREGHGVLASAEQIADAIGAALGSESTTDQVWRLRVVVSGEALAGDVRDEDDAVAVTTPTQRVFAVASVSATASASASASASAPSSANPAFAAAASTGRRSPQSNRASSKQTPIPTPIADPDVALSIALSTTGGTVDRVFGLTSPVSSALASVPDRETHRRTRRGKQRRRAEVTSMVQPRLFKM